MRGPDLWNVFRKNAGKERDRWTKELVGRFLHWLFNVPVMTYRLGDAQEIVCSSSKTFRTWALVSRSTCWDENKEPWTQHRQDQTKEEMSLVGTRSDRWGLPSGMSQHALGEDVHFACEAWKFRDCFTALVVQLCVCKQMYPNTHNT